MTIITQDQIETPPQVTYLPMLTVETILYAVLLSAALFLRLFRLGELPLGFDEAWQALVSWNFIHAVPTTYTGSPVLFTGNALVFLLFGATDTAARILPALFGSALVLVPALLRGNIGRAGALVASALMTFSPSLVLFSRQTDGVMISATCALVAIAFVFRYWSDHAPRDLYASVVFVAIALLGSPHVWTIVAVFALFFVAMRFRQEQIAVESSHLRNAAMLFGLVFIGISTAFMLHREGLGAAFALFGDWLTELHVGSSLLVSFRYLVLYEPVALFFGVIALIEILFMARQVDWHQSPLILFALWAIVATVVYSLVDSLPAHSTLMVIPFALIAGEWIGAWWTRLISGIRQSPDSKSLLLSQEAPLLFIAFALATFLAIVLAEFSFRGTLLNVETLTSSLGVFRGANVSAAIVLGLVLAAFLAVTFLSLTTIGFARSGYLGIFFVLIVMSAWTGRQLTMLNFTLAPNVQELLTPRVASPNVRDMARDVEDASRWRANDSHTLPVVVDESLGALAAWNLRDFRSARIVARPVADGLTQAMLLTPSTPPPAGWMGQRYTLEILRGEIPSANFLRWFLYRDVGTAQTIDAVLWLPPPN